MGDALNPIGHIFEGVWTDWSRGKVTGTTWTLGPTDSTLLTSSLALFVTLTGLQLWTIVRYVLHQRGATLLSNKTSPHLKQQQVILRNANSAPETARAMLHLAWTERRGNGHRSLRAYSIGVVAVLYAAAFMAAGIFSDKAIRAPLLNDGARALLRNQDCGTWNLTYLNIALGVDADSEEHFALVKEYSVHRNVQAQLSQRYAQSCYLGSSYLGSPQDQETTGSCNSLKKPRLYWQNYTSDCPFQGDLCHSSSEAYVLDTGFIDTNDDLGINARPDDRLKYQRVTTCAVINGTSRMQGWSGNITSPSVADKPESETVYAFFGPSDLEHTNHTFAFSNFVSFYDNFTWQYTTPYHLGIQSAFAEANYMSMYNDFEPDAEIQQPNADVTLFFLSFAGMYLGEINDPWYSAHRHQHFDFVPDYVAERYGRDEVLTTLACTERHNLCSSNDSCTGLVGINQLRDLPDFNKTLSSKQSVTFDRMLETIETSIFSQITDRVGVLGAPSLLANNATYAGISGAVVSLPLPEDQWKREINYWHSMAMAHLQRGIAQWATGQIAAQPQYLVPPSTEQDKWFCNNVVVPSASHQSFNLFTIILILIFGTIIIVASFVIEHVVAWVQRGLGKRASRRPWIMDDFMKLSRRLTRHSKKPSPISKDIEFAASPSQLPQSMSFEIKSPNHSLSEGGASSQVLPGVGNSTPSPIYYPRSPNLGFLRRARETPRKRGNSDMIISLSGLNFPAAEFSTPSQVVQTSRYGLYPTPPAPVATIRRCRAPLEHYYTGCTGPGCT